CQPLRHSRWRHIDLQDSRPSWSFQLDRSPTHNRQPALGDIPRVSSAQRSFAQPAACLQVRTALTLEPTKHEGRKPRVSERHAVGCCEELAGSCTLRMVARTRERQSVTGWPSQPRYDLRSSSSRSGLMLTFVRGNLFESPANVLAN